MTNVLKIIGLLILGVIALKISIGLIGSLFAFVLSLIIPAAILIGIVYVLYTMSGRKSIGGGGRSLP